MLQTLLLTLLLVACASPDPVATDPPSDMAPALKLQIVTTTASFPVLVTAPAGDSRLFVVEKGGKIRILKNGQFLTLPFLDLSSKVSGGGEQGLLGVAFHPRYATNGIFVVDYTDTNGDTRIATFKASGNPDRADAASEQIVLTVDQPYSNHNGGNVVFGPDGKLFIGMGDGGSGGDPQGHGQNPNDLLGSILRLDIQDDGTMRIPTDNPFVGRAGYRAELWNLGMRNPWRFSFDRENGDLYIADVGQGVREEVNVSTTASGRGKGLNYGWNIYEGTTCYTSGPTCTPTGFTMPVLEYTHSDGCSITGGFVYRGAAIPALRGTYFYSDYCTSWIRSFKFVGGQATEKTSWSTLVAGGNITSYGEDGIGELYVMNQGGTIYRIVAAP